MLTGTDIPADKAEVAQKAARMAYNSTLLFPLSMIPALGLLFGALGLMSTTQAIRQNNENGFSTAGKQWAQVMRGLIPAGMLASIACLVWTITLGIPGPQLSSVAEQHTALPDNLTSAAIASLMTERSKATATPEAPIDTPAASETPLPSSTPTITDTPTLIPSPTITPTPTRTPSLTPTVTLTPTSPPVRHAPPASPPAEYCKTGKGLPQITGNTYICIASEPGDPVGLGQNWVMVPESSGIGSNFTSCSQDFILASGLPKFLNPDDIWRLQFNAPKGKPLVVGIYENVVAPLKPSNRNGLIITGEGRGCEQNLLSGRFEVLQTGCEANASGPVFVATFEQSCQGKPPLKGMISVPVKLKN